MNESENDIASWPQIFNPTQSTAVLQHVAVGAQHCTTFTLHIYTSTVYTRSFHLISKIPVFETLSKYLLFLMNWTIISFVVLSNCDNIMFSWLDFSSIRFGLLSCSWSWLHGPLRSYHHAFFTDSIHSKNAFCASIFQPNIQYMQIATLANNREKWTWFSNTLLIYLYLST